jgi:hypothetical protein
MHNTIKVILATGLITLATSANGFVPAKAAPPKCGEREKIIKVLKDDYNEAPLAMGLSQKSTEAFEIFTSDKGTWTVMMTMSNGMTCIMAAGHSWQNLPKELAGIKT